MKQFKKPIIAYIMLNPNLEAGLEQIVRLRDLEVQMISSTRVINDLQEKVRTFNIKKYR